MALLGWQRVLPSSQANSLTSKQNIVGITGSAGKTTVSYYLYNLFLGKRVNVACINSYGAFCGSKQITTVAVDKLSFEQIQEVFQKVMQDKPSIVFIEITPNLVANKFIKTIELQALIVTNLLVKDLQDPKELAKAENIFEPINSVKEKGLVVINGDDAQTDWLQARASQIKRNVFAAWCKKDQLVGLKTSLSGTEFFIGSQKFQLPAKGEFNVDNIMLAIRFAVQYITLEHTAIILSNLAPADGRFTLAATTNKNILIDSGSSAGRIEVVVNSARKLLPAGGRLIVVAGGSVTDRAMEIGYVIAKHADVIIFTCQSTYESSTAEINALLVSGAEKAYAKLVANFETIEEYSLADKNKFNTRIGEYLEVGWKPMFSFDEQTADNRKAAMQMGIDIASEHDLVVICGVGDATEIDLGEKVELWNELEVVSSLAKQA